MEVEQQINEKLIYLSFKFWIKMRYHYHFCGCSS